MHQGAGCCVPSPCHTFRRVSSRFWGEWRLPPPSSVSFFIPCLSANASLPPPVGGGRSVIAPEAGIGQPNLPNPRPWRGGKQETFKHREEERKHSFGKPQNTTKRTS